MTSQLPSGRAMGFIHLPDELLEAILQYLGPADTVALGRSCKQVNKVTNSPLLWRRHCLERWDHWHAKHELFEKLSLPVTETGWHQLFNERIQLDLDMLATFNQLLSTQRYRYQRVQEITVHGQDLVDLMISLRTQTSDDAADVLARRYHAGAILGQMRRAKAVDVWMRLGRGDDVKLEEALGAYDLFVFPYNRLNAGDLPSELDSIAERIKASTSNFEALPVRQKAILAAESLRSQGLLGMSDESQYYSLRNSFMSTAFTEHSSLPLQSTAIYCAIARRLGIDANPSNYPQHVYTVIKAPQNQSLDGEARVTSEESELEEDYMYMDPWGSSEEVPVDQLHLRLNQMGIPREEHSNHMGAASVLEMTIRTGRNIMVSVEEARHNPLIQQVFPDVEAAWYSMLWVMVILGDMDNAAAFTRRRQFIPYLVQHFQAHAPEDIPLMDLVPPLFNVQREHEVLLQMLAVSREADAAERIPTSRSAINAGVQYKIGHYFRHRRYDYRGFIIGWDVHCAAPARWINEMRVDDLPQGRAQPFYNIVADDMSTRYVAEENIELVHSEPTGPVMDIAGRYFKRWDGHEQKFVSNIRDEYPDD